MVADSAGAELNAVANDVVLVGEDVAGILFGESLHTALGHREGVVGEDHAAAFLIVLEHREVDDEAEFKAALIDQVEAVSNLCPDLTGELGSVGGGVGDEVDDVAGLGAVAADELFAVALFEELINGAVKKHILGDLYIAQTLHADGQGVLFHLLEPALGARGGSGNIDGTHGLFEEGLEVGLGEHIGDLDYLEGVPEVGLVCTVAEHALSEGDTPERRLADLFI